ncbi:MAG: maleylpyruvate isomerase N-terminal domain-containing protein [Trebonia sp.]
MEIAAHIDALERDGALLADAAQTAGLTAAVPTCPGWEVRDLVRHQAYVHAWAARHVTGQPPAALGEDSEEAVLAGGPDDAELVDTYRSGHAALVAALRAADPDLDCPTFMPAPSPLAFWARRQAHETAIHRYDAQSAAPGGAPAPGDAFGTAFADDGIDELIMGFAARRRYRLRADGTRSLAVRATETGNGWHVGLADGATRVARRGEAGDSAISAAVTASGGCLLEGPAAGIYAYLWNRSDAAAAAVTVTGDPAILDVWRSSVRVAW